MFILRPVADSRILGGYHWSAVCEVCGEELGDADGTDGFAISPMHWRTPPERFLAALYEHWRDRDKRNGCQWKARYRGD